MSAYVVSKDTAVVVAYYAVKANKCGLGPVKREDVAKAYEVLMRENVRSVNYRYGENDEPVLEKVTDAELYAVSMLPAHVAYGCCRNLDYQSCETPDYGQTKAFSLLQAAQDEVVRKAFAGKDCGWGLEPGALRKAGGNVRSLTELMA